MKTNALIQHLETQNCKKCKVKDLCDQAGGEECLLPKMAAQALRDLTESLQRLRKDKADLQHNLMVAESEREYHRSRAAFFGEVAGVTDKVISVEGYKAFRGTMKIRPKTAAVPSFELSGDWLYKPDTGCWYGKGSSFTADICTIVSVESRPRAEWEPRKDAIGFVRCSNCRDCNTYDEWPDGKKWNFCPNCGAEMKKEVKV